MRIKFTVILCFWFSWAIAQTDSIKLRAVEISENAHQSLQGSFALAFDSLSQMPIQAASLSSLLQNSSGVFMKDYGPGQLSTPTFRGGDANQTTVLYNGAKINSPTLGSIDFTLIPASQFKSLELISSASANALTTGGIGGGVLLKSAVSLSDNFLSAVLGIGSFENQTFNFNVNRVFSLKKIKAAVYFSSNRISSQNTFDYLDIYDQPFKRKIRTHNEFNAANDQLNAAILIKSKTLIRLNTWFTNASRNVPKPINLKETFTQYQNDISQRAQVSINHTIDVRHSLYFMLFFDHTINQYADSLAGIDNSNTFNNGQFQGHWNWQIKKSGFSLSNQILSSYTEAASANFSGAKNQLNLGSMHKLSYHNTSWTIDAGTRTMYQDGQSQLLPFISSQLAISKDKGLVGIASISRSARFPTLNELYWQPGGNILLNPEVGNTIEFGIRKLKKETIWSAEVMTYLSVINNRVRWLPNGSTFSPINIAQSRNIGVDAKFNLELIRQKYVKFDFTEVISLIDAQGRITSDDDYETLSFIPSFKNASSFILKLNQLNISVTHSVVGKRFITNDRNAYMPYFQLIDCFGAFRYKAFNLSFGIQNVANVNYQNLPWRPMPGRSYQVQCSVNL